MTKPMEQAMATLDDIDTVTSTSSENYSLVILQFNESREHGQRHRGNSCKRSTPYRRWDEMVQTPTIMKINPDCCL